MDNTASPDLLDRLQSLITQRDDAAEAVDIFRQDALTAPAPDDLPEVTSDEAADIAADEVDTFADAVRALMAAAGDDELVAAYARSGGEVGDLAAETLHGEMQRRGLAG